jgi:hypothetical protein
MPDASWAWPVLDIAPTGDETEIRRAYVRRLKAIDPETDAAAFIELREARDLILYVMRRTAFEAARAAGEGVSEALGQETGRAPAKAAAPPAPATPAQEAAPREEPEIDPEYFARIERMLFGDEAYDADALGEAAAALFAHQALDRIVMAESIQNWAINAIVNSAPRSDPLIEPAIARFGWDQNLTDWRRAPVLDWILDRRRDAQFERDLIAFDPKYADVLAALRTPGAPAGKPAWTVADGVRAFLYHARLQNPTSIALCDHDAVAWWDNFLRSPTFPYGTFGPLVRNWYNRDDPYRIFGAEREPVSAKLFFGALLLPVIFAWPLLRPGYPKVARILALLWLMVFSAGIMLAPPLPDAPRRSAFPSAGPPNMTSNYSTLTDPDQDINPILDRFTGGQLHLSGLRSSNPRLSAQLEDAWQVAKDRGETGRDFYNDVLTVLRTFYREGIRAAAPGYQLEYWQLKLDQLRWIQRYGAQYCSQYRHDPDYPYRYPPDVLDRAARLRNQVWASVNADPPPHRSSVMVPGEIVEAATRRAHLGLPAFRAAMHGDGPEENICAAEIAIAETALARPPAERTRLLHNLTLVE